VVYSIPILLGKGEEKRLCLIPAESPQKEHKSITRKSKKREGSVPIFLTTLGQEAADKHVRKSYWGSSFAKQREKEKTGNSKCGRSRERGTRKTESCTLLKTARSALKSLNQSG